MPLAGLGGEWVLWTGTVGFDRPLGERVGAATAAGYGAVSTSPREADALRIGSINAIALRGSGRSDEAIAEQFAEFCDRAAEAGCRVHLEFAAHSGVPDVGKAWDIVRLADRPNGGLLFDSWHFFRGGADLEALAAVPGDRIFAVQLSDGTAEPVGHWYEETMHHRLLPGDGAFDLVAAVRVLAGTGALTLLGPEVISDELHARSAHESAALAAERLEALWAAAVSAA